MESLNAGSENLKEFLNSKIEGIKQRGASVTKKDLFKTDLGYLTSENLEYLYSQQRLLSFDGENYVLTNRLIQASNFERPVQYYSLFLIVSQDIENSTGIKEVNAIVDVMRNGINNTNQVYPRVDSIIRKAEPMVVKLIETRRGRGNRKRSSSFEL